MTDLNRFRDYPILLTPATPAAIERLLRDFGVPVSRGVNFLRSSSSEALRPGIVIRDLSESTDEVFAGAHLTIAWQDLMPDGATAEALEAEPGTAVRRTWRENGVAMTERIVDEPIARGVVDRLKQRILSVGLFWIRLAPWPPGYDGVFNFRVDIDEPEPDDWRRVIDTIDRAAIEPGVTWFLSTRATEQAPEIYARLAGRDVQSHGDWHHVHQGDARLNALNIAEADRILRSRGFRPEGFAAPCGRLVPDLAESLLALGYRYLCGLDGLCGSIPRTGRYGIRLIHALPVSEGAFLEAGIDSIDTIVKGYLAIASRAISHDFPLFWYGHPERRLGRRPLILKTLLDELGQFGKLWHVGLGDYDAWLQRRDRLAISVARDRRTPHRVELHRNLQADDPPAMVWVEDSRYRWCVDLSDSLENFELLTDPDQAARLPQRAQEPRSVRFAGESDGWRSYARQVLDWERETPVERLRGGPPVRRLKGALRKATDAAWRRKIQPREWSLERTLEERSA